MNLRLKQINLEDKNAIFTPNLGKEQNIIFEQGIQNSVKKHISQNAIEESVSHKFKI